MKSLESPCTLSVGNIHGMPARGEHLAPLSSELRVSTERSELLSTLWRGSQQGQRGDHRQSGHHVYSAPEPEPQHHRDDRGQGRHHNWRVCGYISVVLGKAFFLEMNQTPAGFKLYNPLKEIHKFSPSIRTKEMAPCKWVIVVCLLLLLSFITGRFGHIFKFVSLTFLGLQITLNVSELFFRKSMTS